MMPRSKDSIRDEVDRLLPAGTWKKLGGLLLGAWLGAARRSLDHAGEQVGGAPPDLDDPDNALRRFIEEECGRRIRGIEDETRRRVAGYVERGMAEGMSPQDLAKLIEADESGAFSRARALVIARTETGTAYNRTALAGYRASGRVEKVQVFDGDGCGWTRHDDPDLADGSVRTLDEAEKCPLSHPNCVRAWAPVVETGAKP